MTDVFISYKRRMRDRVQQIAARLEALGVDVWFDAELEPGATFSTAIAEQVRSARCVLVCWSNDAFPHGGDKHGWVRGEATIGRERGVLVAVSLEHADLDPPWNMVHTEDLSGFGVGGRASSSQAWRNVLLAIGRHLNRPGLAELDRARTSRAPSAELDWARDYPDDPVAAKILAHADSPLEEDLATALEAERQADNARSGIAAVIRAATIAGLAFLLVAVFVGFWAWQEGFINLDAMFGKGQPVVTTATQTPVAVDSTGPGNTETPTANPDPATQLKADERLATEVATADTAAPSVEPLALQSPTDGKTEERLGGATETGTAEQAVAAIDPSTVAGSQSLLLEASDNGTTGAVPFSGTVDWSKGADETGLPTLIGKATIPARNLSVELLIRKNSDPSLPASHLMEINFSVSDSFIGGSIAGLPGVLLKNEELVQGAPLVGASTRVVGNSFLLALSSTPEDLTANVNLLTTRKWMDLALIYASGKRAIITLEKDAAAQALFTDVFANWGNIQPAAAYVQFSSSPTLDAAEASRQSLRSRFGELLSDDLVIQSTDLGSKGTWYRVKMPAPSLADALSVCANIRAYGGDCIVSGR